MRHSRETSVAGDSIRNAPPAASKQEEIYATVVTEFGPSLARLAAAYEANRTQREDLLQDLHLALWRSFSTFANQCSLRTWVYRVAHNTAATHIRTQRRSHRSKSMSLDDLADLGHKIDGQQCVDQTDLLTRMYELVQKLKPIDREVLLLYLEGMEAAEIAEVVGISKSNVAQKIHRSKKVLKRYFSLGGNCE